MLQKVKGKQYAVAVQAFREDPERARDLVQQLASEMDDLSQARRSASEPESEAASEPAQEEEVPAEPQEPAEELQVEGAGHPPLVCVGVKQRQFHVFLGGVSAAAPQELEEEVPVEGGVGPEGLCE